MGISEQAKEATTLVVSLPLAFMAVGVANPRIGVQLDRRQCHRARHPSALAGATPPNRESAVRPQAEGRR
jgi:hypothetical protein